MSYRRKRDKSIDKINKARVIYHGDTPYTMNTVILNHMTLSKLLGSPRMRYNRHDFYTDK